MILEYDCIILGNTPAGRWAARWAVQRGARVALVTGLAAADELGVLREWVYHQWRGQHLSPSSVRDRPDPARVPMDLPTVHAWARIVLANLAQDAAPGLISLGVDWIEGEGHFETSPTLQIQIQQRCLRSRYYLLAFDPTPAVLPGLTSLDVWQPADILSQLHARSEIWPQHLTVLGASPQAVEMSQTLQRLGSQVTLVTERERLLPYEDPEAAFLVQACLEADGVQVWSRCAVEAIAPQPAHRYQIKTATQSWFTDALVVASDRLSPTLPFNLDTLGLEWTATGLRVNRHLRTTHPQIYACGALLGGYALPHLTCHEAELAINNALQGRQRSVDYHQIPWAIFSDPPLARVGLTELQARQYDPKAKILRQPYHRCDRAQFTSEMTGFCKLIVDRRGQLLGAHLVGPEAPEVIPAIALAMKHKHPVTALADLTWILPSFAAIVGHTASGWR